MTRLSLSPELLIGQGASRLCYRHPQDPSLCVKVVQKRENRHYLTDEIAAYQSLHKAMGKHAAFCADHLVETDQGEGLVCALVRDADGSLSRPLEDYIANDEIDDAILAALDLFFRDIILGKRLYLFDFNVRNFVIQQTGDGPVIVFIDLKSYAQYKPLGYLRLERLVPALAMQIVKRRARRLYTHNLKRKPPDFLATFCRS